MLVQPIPKPKYKRERAKNNPKPTMYDVCRYCDRPYAQTHEVFEGNGRRQLSIKYKLQVRLCNDCHMGIQQHPLQGRDLALKKEFQQKFIDEHGYKEWMLVFGRDYSDM